MAETETNNPFGRRLPFGLILAGLLVLGAFAVASGGGGQGCSPSLSNACASHIGFDTGTSQASNAGVNTQSIQVTASPGDMLVVETGNYVAQTSGSNLIVVTTSVTDSLSDTYTHQVSQIAIDASDQINVENEFWTGFLTTSSTIVTIKSNATSMTGGGTAQMLDNIGAYRNVLQAGSVNGTVADTFTMPVLNVTTVSSSSWIVGSTIINDVPPIVTASPGFVQRSLVTGSGGNGADLQDTNSDVVNTNTKVGFAPGLTMATSTFAEVVLEISPTFVDQPSECTVSTINTFRCPLPADTDPFCPTTGDTCHINEVFRSTGINTAQNIVVGTAYCTGITTTGLTTTRASTIEVKGTYAGQSRNDTGAVLLVQFETSSNVPSTTFGAGQCASGGFAVVSAKMTFDTSGTTLTAFGLNEYFCSVVGSQVQASATTLYGWIEITPQSVGNANTGVANGGSTIQYAQWGGSQHSYVQVMEV